MVTTLLLVLSKVNVPVPCKPRPLAVIAAVWLTVPLACRLILLSVAVSGPLMASELP